MPINYEALEQLGNYIHFEELRSKIYKANAELPKVIHVIKQYELLQMDLDRMCVYNDLLLYN